jgi:hypothetical protein
MPSSIDNAEHWRDRAREARTLANTITNARVRASMLRIAEGYDRLAQRALDHAVFEGLRSQHLPKAS